MLTILASSHVYEASIQVPAHGNTLQMPLYLCALEYHTQFWDPQFKKDGD